MQRYNLALLCNDESQQKELCRMSQALRDVAPSPYVLGETSVPHVTVCHFKAEEGSLAEIWSRVKDIKPDFSLTAALFYWFAVLRVGPSAYAGLSVETNKDLFNFQQKVIKGLAPYQPKNKVGHEYFPHFTLGLCDLTSPPPFAQTLKVTEPLARPFETRLALGSGGSNWEFVDVIYEQKK